MIRSHSIIANVNIAKAVSQIGRYPITVENEDSKSFEQFRQRRRESGESDSLNDCFKYNTDRKE